VFETGDLLRGTGTVGVANNQAKYYVMLIPLALMCGVMATKTGDRVLFFSAFALGMAGLYYTFSRGGVLCTLFALGLLPLLLAKRGIVNRKHIVMLLVVGCLAAVVSIPFFYDYLTTRPGYFDLRFKHIYYGIMGVLESSFFGMGMNNFTVTVTEHQYEGIFQTMPIHNHYLRIGMETGILGLLLYLSFFVWVAVQAYRSIFVKDMFLSTTSMALLASLLGIMLYWMDDIFYDIVIRTQFWVLVSLIVVIRRLSSKDLSQGMTAIGTN
jgi:O-antigen ligase